MPLLAHTYVLDDPLTQTSPNGHISTDMSTDRSVEVRGKIGIEQVSFGRPDGAIGLYDNFSVRAGHQTSLQGLCRTSEREATETNIF